MLKLRFTKTPGNSIWLLEPWVMIGSGAGCDLLLNEPGIAQQHAQIHVDHENLSLILLADCDITRVNGRPVKKQTTVTLRVGDVLSFGAIEVQVIDPKREKSQPQLPTPKSEGSGWVLKANHSALANRIYPLTQNMLVGRSNECDIVLAAAHLSRRHAQLMIREGILYVKDLDSANGTYLNGTRVTEARVKRGDDLCFDSLSFGVIGPADELDKTSIRTQPPANRPQLNPAAAEVLKVTPAVRAAPVVVARVGKTASASDEHIGGPGNPRAPSSNAANNTELASSAEPSGGRRFVTAVGLILIIAAGLLFFWQNNWFSG